MHSCSIYNDFLYFDEVIVCRFNQDPEMLRLDVIDWEFFYLAVRGIQFWK